MTDQLDTDRAMRNKLAQSGRPQLEARKPTGDDRLGNYLIVRQLGEGGMGAVYLARDPDLGREVAIKVINPWLLGPTMKPEIVERFRLEARAAAKVSHPNVVTIYAFSMHEGKHLLIMEFLNGRTFKDLIGASKTLPPEQVIRLAIEVLQGLEAVHAAGMVHRDLKPMNLMLMPNGRVKILDFGLVKDVVRPSELTQVGMAMGSPLYIAPEQLSNVPGTVDKRADLYSLAVVLFHLLTGHPPFESDRQEDVLHLHLVAPMPALVSPRGPVPSGLIDIVRRAMSKKPDERYASASDMRTALERLQVSLKATVPSKRVTVDAPRAPVLSKAKSSVPRTNTPSGALRTMTFSQRTAPSSTSLKTQPVSVPRPPRPSGPPPPPPAAMRPRSVSTPPPAAVEAPAPAKRRTWIVPLLTSFAIVAAFSLVTFAWVAFDSRSFDTSDASSASAALATAASPDAAPALPASRTADEGCQAYEENHLSLAIEILKPLLKTGSLDAGQLYCLCAAEHFLSHVDEWEDCQLYLRHPKRDQDKASQVDAWTNDKSKIR